MQRNERKNKSGLDYKICKINGNGQDTYQDKKVTDGQKGSENGNLDKEKE